MAGLGRRSHYRKHLTDAVLNDLPEPQDGECIAKVVATRGGNQFDVLVVGVETPQLAILPTKFHKLIWVKRGDFCIVRTGDESAKEDTCSGVRYLITHVLYKDQVKHLKSKQLWPEDEQFATLKHAELDRKVMKEEEEESKWTNGEEDEEDENDQQDDGIVYDSGYDDDDDDDELFVNTNRVSTLQIQDSDSESSDEE